MKSRNSIILLLVSFFVLSAQSTLYAQKVKYKEIESGIVTEKYFFDKKTKLNEGEYVKIHTSSGDTICDGEYKQGERIGEWRFSRSKFTYNYTSAEFNYLDSLLVDDNRFYIKNEKAYSLLEVDRPALYLDSKAELHYELATNIIITDDIKNNGIEDYAVASIIVDTVGNFKFYRIEKSFSSNFDQEIINAINNLSGSFLPAIKNNKAIESKLLMVINVSNGNLKTRIKRAPYRIVLNLSYFKQVIIERRY